MKSARLSELIDAHLDGGLSPEEARELSAVLVSSAEARRIYWSQAAVHGLLPEAVHLTWLAGATPEQAQKIVAMPVPGSSRVRNVFRKVAFAAAACFLIAGAVWSTTQEWWPWRDRSVATMVRAPGAVWENRGEIKRDARLMAGRYRLNAGAAEIRFRSGARFIVEAPADIELSNQNQARLLSGQASGFVPPEARGFTVITPGLTLVDLGTAFGVKVPPSGPAEAHVFEGEVAVSTDLGSERSLFRGDAVRLTGEGSFVDIPSRAQDFLSAESLAARESAVAKRHLSQWRTLADRLSRDPATLVHFTCEGQDRYDTVLRNDAAARNADAHTAVVIGAGWTEGRWPGKRALAFRQHGDRVRFEVPGKYATLTLFASVCLDALPNDFNALLMTENHAMGDLRWQLMRDGRVALGLRTGPANDDRRFETVQTAPVLNEASIGRWITLATVLDTKAGTVTHYVDGELAATGKIERKTDAQLNALELGNWGIQLDDPRWTWSKSGGPSFYDRHFVGRIDQFALLSRALSAEEIRTHSQPEMMAKSREAK